MKKGILLLAIGDELLEGRTVDANIFYFGNVLQERGIQVRSGHLLRDSREDIVTFLRTQLKEDTCLGIIVTGGLGPTPDDVTSACIAEAFAVPLEEFSAERELLEDKYAAFGVSMSKNNRKQACFPAGAHVIANHGGTAPGFVLHLGNRFVAALPGVPAENRAMTDDLLSEIKKYVSLAQAPETIVLKSFGGSESRLATRVTHILADFDDVEFHDRFTFPEVEIRLVSNNAVALAQAGERVRALPEIYGEGDTTLAAEVVKLLRQRHETLSVAESCTGGWLSKLMTDVPGASQVFVGGIVSYANVIKTDLLSVDPKLIECFGAVSAEVVEAMAQGVRQRMNSDYALAISGVAGPDGGSADKPVGTTFLGMADSEGTNWLEKRFRWGREQNRLVAAWSALQMLFRVLQNTDPV